MTDCTPYMSDKNGSLRELPCLLFQLGTEDILWIPPDESSKVDIKTESSKFVQISVQYPNLNGTADLNGKGKAAFSKEATAIISAKNMYKDTAPVYTRTVELQLKGKPITVHEGKAIIQRDRLHEVWRRSGIGGLHTKQWTRDDTFTNVRSPCGTDLEKSRQYAAKLGDLGFGVV